MMLPEVSPAILTRGLSPAVPSVPFWAVRLRLPFGVAEAMAVPKVSSAEEPVPEPLMTSIVEAFKAKSGRPSVSLEAAPSLPVKRSVPPLNVTPGARPVRRSARLTSALSRCSTPFSTSVKAVLPVLSSLPLPLRASSPPLTRIVPVKVLLSLVRSSRPAPVL